jgi:hypothetical protein
LLLSSAVQVKNLFYFFDPSIEAALSMGGKNPHGGFVSVKRFSHPVSLPALLFI